MNLAHLHLSLLALSIISITPVCFSTQSFLFLFLLVIPSITLARCATDNFDSCLLNCRGYIMTDDGDDKSK